MRRINLATLLLIAALGPSAAAVPQFPDDVVPREWKPAPEMKKITDAAWDIHDEEGLLDYIETIEKTLAEHPDWLDLHRFYFLVAARTNRVPEIQAKYREMATQDTTNPDMHYLRGLVEPGPAGADDYRKALSLDENHYHARCALGLGLATGDSSGIAEGFEHLFRALRSRPDHPYAYQALAMAYEKGGTDFAQALKVARLWQKVEPESVQPVRHEMEALKHLGQPTEAQARLEAFVEQRPDNPAALRLLISTYEKAGRAEEVERLQIRLAEISKDDPYEAYRTAQLMASKEQKETTLRWLRTAAERGLDNPRQVESDPSFAFVRNEPQYAEALQMTQQTRTKKIPAMKAKLLSELITKPAPPFSVETLGGNEISLATLKGKVVVLDFWSTWCKPCQLTLPLVQKLHETMKDQPVKILCMNVWERGGGRAQIDTYWKANSYPMEVGLGSSEDAKNYGVTGVPALFVIDQQGQIRYQHRGFTAFMDEEIAWVVDSLLGQSDQGARIE